MQTSLRLQIHHTTPNHDELIQTLRDLFTTFEKLIDLSATAKEQQTFTASHGGNKYELTRAHSMKNTSGLSQLGSQIKELIAQHPHDELEEAVVSAANEINERLRHQQTTAKLVAARLELSQRPEMSDAHSELLRRSNMTIASITSAEEFRLQVGIATQQAMKFALPARELITQHTQQFVSRLIDEKKVANGPIIPLLDQSHAFLQDALFAMRLLARHFMSPQITPSIARKTCGIAGELLTPLLPKNKQVSAKVTIFDVVKALGIDPQNPETWPQPLLEDAIAKNAFVDFFKLEQAQPKSAHLVGAAAPSPVVSQPAKTQRADTSEGIKLAAT